MPTSLLVLDLEQNDVKHCGSFFYRHQVLRIIAKDEVQLSLIKDLEDVIEFQVIYHPLTII